MLMELMVTPAEDIYVIETAPEFGGEFLSDVLIPARTGYNLIREAINAVMDRNFAPPKKKKSKGAVAVKYITGPSGTLMSFKPPRLSKRSGIIFSRIFKDIGSKVDEPVTNHDRLGVIITRGETRDEAIARAEAAERGMEIRIRI
jgi:biotin carboxylase